MNPLNYKYSQRRKNEKLFWQGKLFLMAQNKERLSKKNSSFLFFFGQVNFYANVKDNFQRNNCLFRILYCLIIVGLWKYLWYFCQFFNMLKYSRISVLYRNFNVIQFKTWKHKKSKENLISNSQLWITYIDKMQIYLLFIIYNLFICNM